MGSSPAAFNSRRVKFFIAARSEYIPCTLLGPASDRDASYAILVRLLGRNGGVRGGLSVDNGTTTPY